MTSRGNRRSRPDHTIPANFASLLLFIYFFCCSITTRLDVQEFDLRKNLTSRTADPDNSSLLQPSFDLFSLLTTKPSAYLKPSKIFDLYSSQLTHLNFNNSNYSWLCMYLLLSGDLQLNPGPTSTQISNKSAKPPKYPCGICNKNCNWNQPAVACDSCNLWYHTKCMSMNVNVYHGLHNVSWHCFSCGLPNFDSSLFSNSHSVSLSNSFDVLNPGPTPTPKKSAKPPKYPCGICHKNCNWNQPAAACNSCNL